MVLSDTCKQLLSWWMWALRSMLQTALSHRNQSKSTACTLCGVKSLLSVTSYAAGYTFNKLSGLSSHGKMSPYDNAQMGQYTQCEPLVRPGLVCQ